MRRGQDLRMKGHNRIGNLIVPNDNYCRFEEWFNPLLDEMLVEQVDRVRASVLFNAGLLVCARAQAYLLPPRLLNAGRVVCRRISSCPVSCTWLSRARSGRHLL